MTPDSFEPKEQSKASVPYAANRPPLGTPIPAPSERVEEAAVPAAFAKPAAPARTGTPRPPQPEPPSHRARDLRLVGFIVAFAVGIAATLFLFTAVAFGFAGNYNDRILPGVHAGSVDLSGLTRGEAITKLESAFADLSRGEVTITTPVGTATITYQQVGRGPDVEAMADAAMSIGHSGDTIADASSVLHSAAFGEDIPVIIKVDPTALAERIHDLVGTSLVAPQNAQATAKAGTFTFVPSSPGRGVDEKVIGAEIINDLTNPSSPADIQAGGTFVTVEPQVTDTAAQDAISQAQKMIANVSLTWKTPPANAPSTWKPQTWTITAAQIRSWIVFGMLPNGTYAPAVDPSQVEAYLANVTAKAIIPPVEPGVGFASSGKPVAQSGGTPGVGVDVAATTTALSAYLDSLASGSSVAPSLEVVTTPIQPSIASIDTSGMVVIGSQTITFFPGVSNGNGYNIRIPAAKLNGQVVGPGQEFSFLNAVGPIDSAHGYRLGGVILHGQSDHTGAMGGGICSASTTMFDAAGKAGLKIDQRHAHFYYIDRYPVGKDATVYSNGTTTWDLQWTNDTAYPIVIRSWTTYGSQSSITIQLWSMPTGRTVSWPNGVKNDIVKATNNPIEYVSTLKPGQTNVAEYATDGFKTSTTRVVTDTLTGAVIHNDTWVSVYTAVNGQVQKGGTPPPSTSPSPTPGGSNPAPTPTPTPAPTQPPTATPTPAPTPTPSKTRRRKIK